MGWWPSTWRPSSLARRIRGWSRQPPGPRSAVASHQILPYYLPVVLQVGHAGRGRSCHGRPQSGPLDRKGGHGGTPLRVESDTGKAPPTAPSTPEASTHRSAQPTPIGRQSLPYAQPPPRTPRRRSCRVNPIMTAHHVREFLIEEKGCPDHWHLLMSRHLIPRFADF